MRTYEIEDYIKLLQEFELLVECHAKGFEFLKQDLISNPDTQGALDSIFDASLVTKVEDYLWALNPWIYYHPFLMWKELKKIVRNNTSPTQFHKIIKEFLDQTVEYLEDKDNKTMIFDVIVYFDMLIFIYVQLSPLNNYNRICNLFNESKTNINLLYNPLYTPIQRYLNKYRKYADKYAGNPQRPQELLECFRKCIESEDNGYAFNRLLTINKVDSSQQRSWVSNPNQEYRDICNSLIHAATTVASVKSLKKEIFDTDIFQPILRNILNKGQFKVDVYEKLSAKGFGFNQYFFDLIKLGHIEYDWTSGRCYVCKSQLSKISGQDHYALFLLSGGRTRSFIHDLKQKASEWYGIELIEEVQDTELKLLYPSVIYLKGGVDEVRKFMDDFNQNSVGKYSIVFVGDKSLPRQLLAYSIDLNEWEKVLKERINNNTFDTPPNLESSRKFFDIRTWRFTSSSDTSEMCLVRTGFQNHSKKYYIKYRRHYINIGFNEIAWASLYLSSLKSLVFIYYDPVRNLMAFPKPILLPEIISRSLVSCSGHLPISLRPENVVIDQEDSRGILLQFKDLFEFDRFYIVYKMVPETFSRDIAQKLGVKNIIRAKIKL